MGNNKMMMKGDSQSRLLSMHDYTSRAALMLVNHTTWFPGAVVC